MTSRYGALLEENDSDEDGSEGSNSSDNDDRKTNLKNEVSNTNVPSYEDLSLCRADEETVLSAVYGDDFFREDGVWGCSRLNVHVRPPDLQKKNIGCELT